MTDDQQYGQNNLIRNILLGIAVVYIAASLYFFYALSNRLTAAERRQTTAQESVDRRIAALQADLRESTQNLSQKVGLTQKQVEARAAELRQNQRVAESRILQQQFATRKQIGDVTGEVAGVKTDVGSVRSDVGTVKTEVATTKSELEATKVKLERTIGDLGLQSGLIARTREDLEILKHRGDRNYYEFSLERNQKPTPVSTVSLQLKKTNVKKGKYTLAVIADDRKIDKKDRGVNEPVQFYTGRDRVLYELVVNTIDKDRVTGYLSTPKNAPQPVVR